MALRRKRATVEESAAARSRRLTLIDDLMFEVVPMKGLERAVDALPAGARVSVTCSPAKGISATQRAAEDLVERGFEPVPHLSARMVADRVHTRELAAWFRSVGLTRAFVIAGDANSAGAYPDAVSFLRDLLDADHPLTTIGVPGYPDGHPFIADEVLHESLVEKQELLTSAGIDGEVTTQMCFDAAIVSAWLRRQRAVGMILPIHLGVSGVVEKRKLVTMGLRLGVGRSLRFVRKNRAALTNMLAPTAYDPNELLIPLGDDMVSLCVAGLHVFTFNQVGPTEVWRRAVTPDDRC